jgi:hypothetical protein
VKSPAVTAVEKPAEESVTPETSEVVASAGMEMKSA